MRLTFAQRPDKIKQFIDSVSNDVYRWRVHLTKELSVDKDISLVDNKDGFGGFLVVGDEVREVTFHVFGNTATHQNVINFLVEGFFLRLVEHLATDFGENVVLDFGFDVECVEQDLEFLVVSFAQVF